MSGLFQRRFQVLSHLAILPLFCFCSLLLSSLPGCAGGQRGTNISGSGTVRSLTTGEAVDGTVTNLATGETVATQGGAFNIEVVPGEDNFLDVNVPGRPTAQAVLRANDIHENQEDGEINFAVILDGSNAAAVVYSGEMNLESHTSQDSKGSDSTTPQASKPTNKPQKTPQAPSVEQPQEETPPTLEIDPKVLELQARVADCASAEDQGRPDCAADCESLKAEGADAGYEDYCAQTKENMSRLVSICQERQHLCSRDGYCIKVYERYKGRPENVKDIDNLPEYAVNRYLTVVRFLNMVEKNIEDICVATEGEEGGQDLTPVDPVPQDIQDYQGAGEATLLDDFAVEVPAVTIAPSIGETPAKTSPEKGGKPQTVDTSAKR